MATDPVCGMQVDPATSRHQAVHDGHTLHFCSQRCRDRFVADPGRYLTPAAEIPVAAAPTGTTYICPMHPHVRQDHPGTCPICGMALEPEMPTLDESNPELDDFGRRFRWTLPLTLV